MWNANELGIQVAAFIGGIAAVALAVMIPKILRNQSMMTLVLAGVMSFM